MAPQRRQSQRAASTDQLAGRRPHERMRLLTPEPARTQGRRLGRRMEGCTQGARKGWRRVAILLLPLAASALRPSAPEACISEGWVAGASQRGRTHLAHVVLHKAGHAPGSVGRMWHVTAKEQNTRVSESGWAGGKGSGAGRSPDGSALISVSARCSALAKSSSSALPRTKYVAAAAIDRSRETDLVLGFYTYTYTYSSI